MIQAMTRSSFTRYFLTGLAIGGILVSASAFAQVQYRQTITNNMARCDGLGPAVRVNVNGIKSSEGDLRVQLYRGTKEDWLVSGRWLYRIQVPARAGSMSFCLPAPTAGTYAVATRHDVNGNDKTDLRTDGGGMSNNPSINILNLGKPSYTKTRFDVGDGVSTIAINMRYW